ncbi:MAG: molybdopterin-dependent oxidoreductase, partial [Streptosporangiaceae bacterium]|nr:molybdopterin-dependent oxidoreductase [Streptosporangiaceae bacterium]
MTETAAPGITARTRAAGLVGDSPARPDGRQKVTGEFAYSSDLWLDGMLWGGTVRSPHPRARITALDVTGALATGGVAAVLTHEDVPGRKTYGLEHADQPVLACGQVRYAGEPVALVAADHPETARRAADRISVGYQVLPPLTDARAALAPGAPALHDGGNLVRHVRIRKGDPDARADVVVRGEYQVGMQDQAFLGPESGLAVPAEDGGVDLFVATQWLHVDRGQVAASLGLPEELVRITLSGVGGAFGAREDLSMQIHACMLALRTGRPVKMVYSRPESFYGHVHRHPAWLRYEHGSTDDGRLVYVKAETVLDGGAYASSSPAVAANAATLGIGPYQVPNVAMDCYAVYTNNPPCGAMRGFGAVQACFAYESQMDKLAAATGLDPVELRIRNAMGEGSVMPTGQVVDSAAPVAEILRLVRNRPLPAASGDRDLRMLPGGVSNATHGEGVVRGVGYAVGIKNIGYSEGFDDYSTARVRLELVPSPGGEPTAQVHTAAAEVGQGLVTVLEQITRTELGVDRVVILPADTSIGSAGSSSASRQTYMTGGAVRAACQQIREQLDRRGRERRSALNPHSRPDAASGLADLLDEPVEATVTWRHRATHPLDPLTGQGQAHVQYAFAAHRAVVDVDTQLGLV